MELKSRKKKMLLTTTKRLYLGGGSELEEGVDETLSYRWEVKDRLGNNFTFIYPNNFDTFWRILIFILSMVWTF